MKSAPTARVEFLIVYFPADLLERKNMWLFNTNIIVHIIVLV
jgi:hypothetical protein